MPPQDPGQSAEPPFAPDNAGLGPQARLHHDELESLFHASPVGFATINPAMQIVHWNPAMCAAVARMNADADQGAMRELPTTLRPLVRQVLSDAKPVAERVNAACGGGEQWLVQGYPIRNAAGRVRYVGCVVQDVSELGQGERQAVILNRFLADQLEQRNEQTVEQARSLQQLTRRLRMAEQEERKSFAQDLHDGLGQLMVVAKLRLHACRNAKDREAALDALEAVIDEAGEAVRSMSGKLNPRVLEDQGLAPALEWLSQEMMRLYRLRVELNHGQVPEALDGDTLQVVFRAARELLVNVARHSGQLQATLAYGRGPDGWSLEVRDDGVGCDAQVIHNGGAGFGLSSVIERMALIGGAMRFDSAPDGGTHVRLVLPTQPPTDTHGEGEGRCVS